MDCSLFQQTFKKFQKGAWRALARAVENTESPSVPIRWQFPQV
jgi:hypothetical protein